MALYGRLQRLVLYNRVLEAGAGPPPMELARPRIAVKLTADRQLLPAETRRVLL